MARATRTVEAAPAGLATAEAAAPTTWRAVPAGVPHGQDVGGQALAKLAESLQPLIATGQAARRSARVCTARTAEPDEDPRALVLDKFLRAGLPHNIAEGYADLVCEALAGLRPYFPVRNTAARDLQAGQARSARAAGKTWRETAQQLGVSESTARRLVRGAAPEPDGP